MSQAAEKDSGKKAPALKEEYQKKSNKDQIAKFRDDLLFMELFHKKERMVLYDCTNTVYLRKAIGNLLYFSTLVSSGSIVEQITDVGAGLYILLLPFVVYSIYRHNLFLKSFVEKVVYDPVNQKLEIQKRSIFGDELMQTIDATDLIFTSEEKLNKRLINYVNRRTLEQYSIIYSRAWKNFEFFSYLVKQNIRKELFLNNRDAY